MTDHAPRDTNSADLAQIVAAAAGAAEPLAAATAVERADWLGALADAVDADVDELVRIADRETALGETRLRGEVARTSGQLRLFAEVIVEGSWREAIIDHRDPEAGSPDVRRMLVALGPVAVFAASNFPFAFSLLGGDTASAMAAGCPVVAKAHPGHSRLSERVGALAIAALADAGAPDGTFGVVHGFDAGISLVAYPTIRAVGFTGSMAGGRALFDVTAGREDPIPFYGELGSINPVVVTASAAARRADEIAAGLVGSFTLGTGQYCTNPGLVFVPAESGLEQAVADLVADVEPSRMLHDGIASAFHDGLAALAATGHVTVVAGTTDQSGPTATPTVLATTASTLADHPDVLVDECFGPSTLLVSYDDLDQVQTMLTALPGSLVMSVHGTDDDVGHIKGLVAAATDRAGRFVWNEWPTGVAVNWAMHHGGPWPATTAPLHTSVGATAIRRFVRPVAWQGVPDALLPPELREANPLGVPRRVDGRLESPSCETAVDRTSRRCGPSSMVTTSFSSPR